MSRTVLVKITLGVILITSGILTYTSQVGLYDIKIRYDIVPDSLNKVANTQNSTGSVSSGTSTPSQVGKLQENSSSITKKIFENIIYDNESDIENAHGVSDSFNYNSDNFESICKNNEKICKIVYFNGEFSNSEKIKYLSIIIELLNRLDKMILTQETIQSNLYSIRLNKTQDGRRGFAGHHTITSNLKTIETKKEFFEVMSHELGHIIDLGVIRGQSSIQSKTYTEFNRPAFAIDDLSIEFYELSWKNENTRKSGSSFKDFVSGYGMSDPFEDFAESMNMYINHYDIIQKMGQSNYIISQKIAILDKIFGGSRILSDNKNLFKVTKDPSRRPWDTTKIK